MDSPEKPEYFVVLDTNVWVYQTLMLRSALGASLLHLLHDPPGSIGLPAIVHREIVKHARKHGLAAAKASEDGLRRLRMLTGLALPYTLPTAQVLQESAEHRLHELAGFLTPLTNSFEQYQSALSKSPKVMSHPAGSRRIASGITEGGFGWRSY